MKEEHVTETINNTGSTSADVCRDLVAWAREDKNGFLSTVGILVLLAIIMTYCVTSMFSSRLLGKKLLYEEARKKCKEFIGILLKPGQE